MKEEKVFTEEELHEMGMRTADLIQASIDAGDKERAKKLTRRMYREFLAMHDLYRDWLTSLLTFIGRDYGDDVLYQALKESCAAWIKPLTEAYTDKDIRRKAEMLAAGLRGHLQPIEIKEDEEKIIFSMQPCGSGGRLILDGGYGPPRNFLKIKKAQPMTYGRKDFPVYCAHAAFLETLPSEWGCPPPFVEVLPEKLGEEPCQICLYKDPKAIPSEIRKKARKRKSKP